MGAREVLFLMAYKKKIIQCWLILPSHHLRKDFSRCKLSESLFNNIFPHGENAKILRQQSFFEKNCHKQAQTCSVFRIIMSWSSNGFMVIWRQLCTQLQTCTVNYLGLFPVLSKHLLVRVFFCLFVFLVVNVIFDFKNKTIYENHKIKKYIF